MIFNALNQITKFINQVLAPVGLGNLVMLADVARHERPAGAVGATDVEEHILLTLINIEEENALKNNYPVQQIGSSLVTRQSALFLNLYVLLAANFTHYDEALKAVDAVLRVLQSHKKIRIQDLDTGETFDLFPAMHHIGFENLNNLWTVLGGKYMPSVLYKFRLVMVQESPPTGGQVITDIQATSTVN